MNKYETGSVYVGVVGSEIEYGECRDSISQIIMRPGDLGPNFARSTKGYEGRNWHVKQFLASKADFILFLDGDMVFAPDTLERLRGHGLPYVSGLYMRRQYAPIAPIWFEPNPLGEWPYLPWVGPIEQGKLHEIGASGWGCVLVHRDVFEAMRPLLHGEPFILEDALTLWPFDVAEMFGYLRAGDLDGLRRVLRPLRGRRDEITGSDIRFPFFANQAGFLLYGDPDVRPGHIILYPLSPADYDTVEIEKRQEARDNGARAVDEMRAEWRQRVAELRGEL